MSVDGDLPGLDQALIQALKSYKPGPGGLALSTCVISLAAPEWAVWSWWDHESISIAAAGDTLQAIFTVPQDERAWLYSAYTIRSSGDGNIVALAINPPANYGGATPLEILRLGTATTRLWWPDIAARQTLDASMESGPILMEPGATLEVLPDGSGVAISVYLSAIILRRTKLVRAQAP